MASTVGLAIMELFEGVGINIGNHGSVSEHLIHFHVSELVQFHRQDFIQGWVKGGGGGGG